MPLADVMIVELPTDDSTGGRGLGGMGGMGGMDM